MDSTITTLESVYGSHTVQQLARYRALNDLALAKYGKRPDYFVRCPGRVNIIGEHIDYSGYSVFPCAIEQDIVTAVVKKEDLNLIVELSNINTASYSEGSFCGTKPLDLVALKDNDWKAYFQSGVLGVKKLYPELQCSFSCIVDGTVPIGMGLSSSSALTCSGVLASFATLKVANYSMEQLASIAIAAEKLAGVECGGMDQSASILSKKDNALLVTFFPSLSVANVGLPFGSEALLVVANSLVKSNKRLTSSRCYNKRVVELRLATALLSQHVNLKTHCSTLRELQHVLFSNLPDIEALAAMSSLARNALKQTSYSKQEIASLLFPSCADQALDRLEKELISPTVIEGDDFMLYNRVKHVIEEAARVLQFVAKCKETSEPKSTVLEALGKLMDESMTSCKKLYECSCPELDQLVCIAKESGAYGSRLTGAGWGGCTVSLIKASDFSNFKKAMSKNYYSHLNNVDIDQVIFPVRPSSGSFTARNDV